MSVHLLMSAGRGPQECAWALARLLRRLEADATRQDMATRRVQTVPGDRPGTYRSVLLQISGDGAEAFAAWWTGTLAAVGESRSTTRGSIRQEALHIHPDQILHRGW